MELDTVQIQEAPPLPETPRMELPEQAPLRVIVIPPPPEPMVMPPAPEPEPEPEPEPPAPILVISAKWATPARRQIAAMTTRGEMWWLEPGDDRLDGITIDEPDDLDAPRILTGAQFVALFTAQEVAALMAIPECAQGALMAAAQNQVNMRSGTTAALIGLGVQRGALSQARADVILAGG